MKPIVRIYVSSYANAALVETLSKLHPDGELWCPPDLQHEFERLEGWEIWLPLDDEITQHALRILRRRGHVTGPEHQPVGDWRHVSLSIRRERTPAEWRRTRLLHLRGSKHVEWGRRIPETLQLHISAKELRASATDTMYTGCGGTIVSSRVRAILDQAGLVGVEWRDVLPTGRRGSKNEHEGVPWSQVSEPWWELRSPIRMPEFSPSMVKVTSNGTPFVGYEKHRLEIRRSPFTDLVLRYRAADLVGLPPFDLAMTYEHLPLPPCGEWLIASQALYRLLRKHGVQVKWNMVEIEDYA